MKLVGKKIAKSYLLLVILNGTYIYRECVHMTSRQPCSRSKQRNGTHLGGVKYSFGDETLFLCKSLLLFHYANMASGHVSEHTLYKIIYIYTYLVKSN